MHMPSDAACGKDTANSYACFADGQCQQKCHMFAGAKLQLWQ
jgi:hypothetical protein